MMIGNLEKTKDRIKIKKNYRIFRLLILILILIIIFFVSLLVGTANVTISKLFKFDSEAWFYIFKSRFPRTMAVVLVAISLSLSGLIMQTISRNKLVSPSTIGTTSAAKLGILISVIFLSPTYLSKIGFSFTFAMIFTLFFMYMLNKIKSKNAIYIPLIGMMLGGIIDSISFLIADSNDLLDYLTSLNIGSFTLMTAGRFEYLYILIIPVAIGIGCLTIFNIIGVGEDFAKGLGVNYKFYTSLGVMVVALISAITFVLVGPIPFLGLIIPNMATLFFGDNLKKSVFEMTILGSIFLLICDILSRSIIYPFEIQTGVIVGVIGGITFLVMILTKVKSKK